MSDKYICVYKPLEIVIVIQILLLSAKLSQREYQGAIFSQQPFLCNNDYTIQHYQKMKLSGSVSALGGNTH